MTATPPHAPRRRPRRSLLLGALLALASAVSAAADPRPHDPMDGAELRAALRKLQVTGSALFVAAHPDDENTSFLSWLSNGRRVRTAYLSVTRGDGGQNLIGAETGEALGVIRTHELLAARRIDGAEQFFTRALDFGYSKTPDETLALWERERILGDVVWVIRRFQPDVIVTRFGTDGSGGHGHHTASAVLAGEAFRAAADPKRFPEQLAFVKPWQAKRLLWNNWRAKPQGRDPALPRLLSFDVGTYEPLLGRAHSELAGQSRSMHKSQGFGSLERRGSTVQYLEHVDGNPAEQDLFEGVDLSWARVPGGAPVGALLREAERAFDPDRPAAVLPKLLAARAALHKLAASPIVEAKRRELDLVIRSAAGLWAEAIVSRPTVVPGGRVDVTVTLIQRADAALTVERVALPHGAEARRVPLTPADSAGDGSYAGAALAPNQPFVVRAQVTVPDTTSITQPYWLRERPATGAFRLAGAAHHGAPENAPALQAKVTLAHGVHRFDLELPVVHRWVDPVQGERWRDLAVVPPVTVRIEEPAYVFPDAAPKEVRVVLESADSTLSAAAARLVLPSGWRAEPARADVRFEPGERERTVRFQVTPSGQPVAARMEVAVEVGARSWSHTRQTIDYPHVPLQLLFPPAEARLVRADVRHTGASVGYVMGSGDQVPAALRQIGYRVTLLSDEDLETQDLSRYDAIVTGVRAYNTRPRLKALQPRLLDYVKEGGRLVVQYVTADASLNALGPYPFTISRERVSVEDAEMRVLRADHALVTQPNRIGPADFAGWVQERGLYYASPWDPRYETVLAANDPGEPSRDGGLLVASHGRGTFVYTGLSWFRQLPAGVPGAYRLFANLVSAPGRP